jgi:hypothetical protein
MDKSEGNIGKDVQSLIQRISNPTADTTSGNRLKIWKANSESLDLGPLMTSGRFNTDIPIVEDLKRKETDLWDDNPDPLFKNEAEKHDLSIGSSKSSSIHPLQESEFIKAGGTDNSEDEVIIPLLDDKNFLKKDQLEENTSTFISPLMQPEEDWMPQQNMPDQSYHSVADKKVAPMPHFSSLLNAVVKIQRKVKRRQKQYDFKLSKERRLANRNIAIYRSAAKIKDVDLNQYIYVKIVISKAQKGEKNEECSIKAQQVGENMLYQSEFKFPMEKLAKYKNSLDRVKL